jgi:hypothetical protein
MLVALASAVCALSGCGMSTSDQIQAKVKQFAHAVAARDSRTLCDQVFAPVLLEHFASVGLPCERAMQIYLSSVHAPTLAVGRVVVSGQKAEAITLSGAHGQIGSLDAIELVETSQGWRVSGLGSPVLSKHNKHA